MLASLPLISDSNLIIGLERSEDAGVYRLCPELALIQTVDFFTPIVDEPYQFGQIAAANALSDIYAKGGKPLTALNIVCFPIKTLDLDILKETLRGGLGRNRDYRRNMVSFGTGIPEYVQDLLFDPQTSGGLLIALAPGKAAKLLKDLRGEGIREAAIIGEFVDSNKGKISVE